MSIEVISQVMQRYPGAGTGYLVALALADNASTDGQRIYPSVESVALRSRVQPRTVQYHIARMVASGWLVLVRPSSGRPGDTNHYRISPEWLAGGEPVAPQSPVLRGPRPVRPAKVPGAADAAGQTGANLAPVLVADLLGTSSAVSVDNCPQQAPRRVHGDGETGAPPCTQTVKNLNTNTPLTPIAANFVHNPQAEQSTKPKTRRTDADNPMPKSPSSPSPQRSGTQQPAAQHPTAEPPTAGLSGEQPTAKRPTATPAAAGQPTAAHPQPDAMAQTKVPACAKGKRWRSTRSGVERVGVALGFGPWDEAAYSAALMRGSGVAPASFAAYEAAVLAELARRGTAQRLAHGGLSAAGVLPSATGGFVAAAPLAAESCA